MTERERFQIRGLYAIRTGDYNQCIKDTAIYSRNIPRTSVGIINAQSVSPNCKTCEVQSKKCGRWCESCPNHVVFRTNLAVFMNYAGDFSGAEQELVKLEPPSPYGVGALAFSLLGQGRVSEAADMYKKLATTDAWGASFATAGPHILHCTRVAFQTRCESSSRAQPRTWLRTIETPRL